MKHKSLMLMGTASSVGKSILAAGLCRILTQDKYKVTPFKSQNMSLNSWITPEGHEMGRAQVMQAEAAKIVPSAQMNPILLKPTTDRRSQVIINGKVHATMDAVEYFAFKPKLKEKIKKVYYKLAEQSDVMIIEGAGSPAEINLKENDIVNMGVAEIAKAPVVLIGDIDKGGVFASLVGTMMLLSQKERKRVKGVIINKFRGSVEILEPGLNQLEDLIGVPVLGVIPYFQLDLEDEDSVTDFGKFTRNQNGDLDVAVIRLPYMSNFTDFNALNLHQDVNIRFVELKEKLGNPDLIIIPGSKSTISDLNALRAAGMESQIQEARRLGSFIMGICGGFQMLGKEILDPEYVESEHSSVKGLGFLEVATTFQGEKKTTLSEGIDTLYGETVQGYEIHMGRTVKESRCADMIRVSKQNKKDVDGMDGARTADGKVMGTYFHGIFDNGAFTRRYLDQIRRAKGLNPIVDIPIDYWDFKDQEYDKLAEIVRANLNMKEIYNILESGEDD